MGFLGYFNPFPSAPKNDSACEQGKFAVKVIVGIGISVFRFGGGIPGWLSSFKRYGVVGDKKQQNQQSGGIFDISWQGNVL